jgi:hypothetical protein
LVRTPYAAFADADDNLFTGMFASVSKALKIALVPQDTSNPSSLKDFLIRWRQSSCAADARVAEVVDAHIMISIDDVAPLSAAVHSFMVYAAAANSLTDLERRLCVALKEEVYAHYSVLFASHVPLPVFPPDSLGNVPCVRLIGIEFSSLPNKRLEPPRFLLLYSRSYHHLPNSPENFTYIDVYDSVSGDLQCLFRTCCITGHIVSASIDFNLKLVACIAASESISGEPDTPPSQDIASAFSGGSSSAYWSLQSSTVASAAAHVDSTSLYPVAAENVRDFGAVPTSFGDNSTAQETVHGHRKPESSLRINVDDIGTFTPATEASGLSRSSSGKFAIRQHFDYRTFVWSFRNSVADSAPDSHSAPASDVDDLQLEWYYTPATTAPLFRNKI